MHIETDIIAKDNPIHSPNFLRFQAIKRKKKKKERERLQILTVAFSKLKIYMNSRFTNKTWNTIRKRVYAKTGDSPPYMLKDWFFSK